MNAIEGQLNIDLYPNKIAQARVEISSSRPLQASRVMIGKTPEEVLKVLPLMYNVCGVAQARTSLRPYRATCHYLSHAMQKPPETCWYW